MRWPPTQFKVDRLQIILVAKNIYIYVSQLFISRMPKMCAIPQLVSAPLNPIPILLQNILGGATHYVSTLSLLVQSCEGTCIVK